MYVVENQAANPFEGVFEFRGKIAASTDKWAIDGNVFRHNEQLYMIWSGWEGDENGQQDIFIAKMKNPLEIRRRPGENCLTHLRLGKSLGPRYSQPRPTQSICKRRPAVFVAWRPDFYCVLSKRLLDGFL